jgi:Flp pilus assembly protein TadD
MKRFQILLLCLFCLVNVAATWSSDSKVQNLVKRGYQAWHAGNRAEAIAYYKNALELDPQQLDALNSLGVIYEEMGFTDKAEEKYLSVLKLNDDYMPAYSNLGYLYWNQGDIANAIHYFQKRAQYGGSRDPWAVKAKKALETIKKNQSG